VTDPYLVPELARGLRVFGAPVTLGGVQERLFAPLLDARRAAARATRWQDRLAAFDGDRIEATLRVIVQTLAEEHHPRSAPDRRALAARLDDAFVATRTALRRAQVAATGVRETSEGERPAAWQRWLGALARVFSEADLALERAGNALEPPTDRRVLGGRRTSRAGNP
jgi:hypothetical protein